MGLFQSNMEIIFTALGLILAWFVYRLAIRQKKVSEVQLRRDSYDRNYRIYSAAEKFIYKIKSGWILNSDFEEYKKNTKQSKYLLDTDVNNLLDKIGKKGLELAVLIMEIKNFTEPLLESEQQEKKNQMSRKSDIVKDADTLSVELKDKFDPLLKVN